LNSTGGALVSERSSLPKTEKKKIGFAYSTTDPFSCNIFTPHEIADCPFRLPETTRRRTAESKTHIRDGTSTPSTRTRLGALPMSQIVIMPRCWTIPKTSSPGKYTVFAVRVDDQHPHRLVVIEDRGTVHVKRAGIQHRYACAG
jgi:hypothetical protein